MTGDDDLTYPHSVSDSSRSDHPRSAGGLHDLLTQVAAGELDPAEAARLLDQDPNAPTLDQGAVPSYQSISAISINAVGVRLQVFADPTVASAVAEGPHLVHQDGSRLVFDLPGRARGEDGFEANPRWQWGKLRVDWPYGSGERVVVRVNPALALQLELKACDTTVRGLRAALEVSAFSSSINVLDHDGPLSGAITTGGARIESVFSGAADSLTVDMGSLKLTVLPGSDTTMTARSEMGSLKVVGPRVRESHDELTGLHSSGSAVVGAGTGRLDVSVRMGSAKVTVI